MFLFALKEMVDGSFEEEKKLEKYNCWKMKTTRVKYFSDIYNDFLCLRYGGERLTDETINSDRISFDRTTFVMHFKTKQKYKQLNRGQDILILVLISDSKNDIK